MEGVAILKLQDLCLHSFADHMKEKWMGALNSWVECMSEEIKCFIFKSVELLNQNMSSKNISVSCNDTRSHFGSPIPVLGNSRHDTDATKTESQYEEDLENVLDSDVLDFLKTLGLGTYASAFKEEGWERLNDVLNMSPEDIKRCIPKPGHKRRLELELKKQNIADSEKQRKGQTNACTTSAQEQYGEDMMWENQVSAPVETEIDSKVTPSSISTDGSIPDVEKCATQICRKPEQFALRSHRRSHEASKTTYEITKKSSLTRTHQHKEHTEIRKESSTNTDDNLQNAVSCSRELKRPLSEERLAKTNEPSTMQYKLNDACTQTDIHHMDIVDNNHCDGKSGLIKIKRSSSGLDVSQNRTIERPACIGGNETFDSHQQANTGMKSKREKISIPVLKDEPDCNISGCSDQSNATVVGEEKGSGEMELSVDREISKLTTSEEMVDYGTTFAPTFIKAMGEVTSYETAHFREKMGQKTNIKTK